MKNQAEIERAILIHAARLLKTRDCPCLVCQVEAIPTNIVIGALAWAAERPIRLRLPARAGLPTDFAGHLADLWDREDLCKLTHDPRIVEILPDRG